MRFGSRRGILTLSVVGDRGSRDGGTMQETKRIGLELWVGLWAIAGLTALCLAVVGAGWHHLLISLVAFALAYAPLRIGEEIRRRRAAVILADIRQRQGRQAGAQSPGSLSRAQSACQRCSFGYVTTCFQQGRQGWCPKRSVHIRRSAPFFRHCCYRRRDSVGVAGCMRDDEGHA